MDTSERIKYAKIGGPLIPTPLTIVDYINRTYSAAPATVDYTYYPLGTTNGAGVSRGYSPPEAYNYETVGWVHFNPALLTANMMFRARCQAGVGSKYPSGTGVATISAKVVLIDTDWNPLTLNYANQPPRTGPTLNLTEYEDGYAYGSFAQHFITRVGSLGFFGFAGEVVAATGADLAGVSYSDIRGFTLT